MSGQSSQSGGRIGLGLFGSPVGFGFGFGDTCDGLIGDMNCDGLINTEDIDVFALRLIFPTVYSESYPECDPLAGDCSGDGIVSTSDIDCFVAIILNQP